MLLIKLRFLADANYALVKALLNTLLKKFAVLMTS